MSDGMRDAGAAKGLECGAWVLLTGATGFLGTWVARELMQTRPDVRIAALVRPQGKLSGEERLRRLWNDDAVLKGALGTRIVAMEGELCQERFGWDAQDFDALAAQVDRVVHAAAEVYVNKPANLLEQVNVEGTRQALAFAERCLELGGFKRFVHVSTAYVAGCRTGVIMEDSFENAGFNSLYEQTKYQAEELVRAAGKSLPCAVVRPAQIVGDSRTGAIFSFNTVYYPLKMYLKGKLSVMPVSAQQRLNIVPVDRVSRIVCAALFDEGAAGGTYHATLPWEMQPQVGELVEAVRAWAAEELLVDVPRPLYVSAGAIAQMGQARNMQRQNQEKPKGQLRNLLALAPYFYDEHIFDTRNADGLVGRSQLNWREFLPQMLRYAVRTGFLSRSGRTVFEQMQVRLASASSPMTFHDVTSRGITSLSGADMAQRMRVIAAQMLDMGIKAGDRVAMVGVNSINYAATDAACGLIGATTVPIYYTSPFEDVLKLVEWSHSALLFVGTLSLARAAAESALSIPLVSLLEDLDTGDWPPQTQNRLMGWGDFLASGLSNVALLDEAPAVDLDSIATIRYTSGTTGEPKGVTFTHAQLVWMGEVMPAVVDWKTRNEKLRYLSFLPMSHVVEGILVAYAPYYILSQVDFYYLNDFGALTDTLPKVRPSLFFSVPRFYEKVWNQFAATGAGKRWLAMEDSPARRALGAVARRALLRKAGLDACRQLLVGSAPISMDLLRNFRALGIEVHNAFGLTEAPLITLTRLGRNELGSLGDPLPDTEVAIDETGEILMRGPQLTPGYDGRSDSITNEDGWFVTGDLGHWSPEGRVVIEGRRKELLVTSYGKNIAPQKVEALIKDIPGVSEAMLIGDGLPYCTAFAWLEEEAKEGFDGAAFDAAMQAVNQRLSHPEMAKRWAVLEVAPSLAAGELTPNLKIRRQVIMDHNRGAVEALYAAELSPVPGALHWGAQQ